jgi:alpha-D-glucose phosphate-specific phosphoglucomutase
MSITFGTEGWRAVIAEEFTAENVRLVTQAIAEHILETAPRGSGRETVTVAVGYDTRFLSDYFARTVCEVLAGNQIRSVLSQGVIPTCAVSRYVVAKRLPAGVMVTASHNLGIYNGLKVKEAYGGSATPEAVASIENRFGRSPVKRVPFDEALKGGIIERAKMLPLFLQGIKSSVDLPAIRRCAFRVVVDSMHGVGGRLIEGLLKGGRCRVETIHPEADPLFGGQAPEPIAPHLLELAAAVKRRRADIGLATDGDADRLGIVGPDGTWLNPGQVMCVLLTHLVTVRHTKGMVVKTVSNTMMINRVAEALGLRLVEVPVGFKYITKRMLNQDVLIGGEESGGIGIKGYLPERDGIFNGLLVLEALAARQQKLSTMMRNLERQFGQWWYGRRDLSLKVEQVDGLFTRLRTDPPGRIAGVPVAKVSTLDGVKLIGRDESWLLFRRSGTEPIVRIYAETPQKSRLSRLLAFGVGLAEKRQGLRKPPKA